MLDKFIFENHLGKRFDGLKNRVFLNYSDLRDYSWSYDTINSRISRFYRPTTSRKIPLVICCNSDEEAVKIKNELLELTEADIEARLPGKVYIGDYYTKGYITASKKSEYLVSKRMCKVELTLTSDDPAWYHDETHVFLPGNGGVIGAGQGTDYPYDYKYDYALSLIGRSIVCESVGDSAFQLRIYGEAINPAVVIGGHVYAINGTIGKGESLLIDSMSKKITLTTATGGKVNWFSKRGRDSYIFKPIPAGMSTVSSAGTFGFDLTVIEQRSEPKWT